MSNSIYDIWYGMVRRCHDPRRKDYPRYGGSGIAVCDEWRCSFPEFQRWAEASGFARGLQLDRIDNKTGYCPANCRWVTIVQQARNRRTTVMTERKVACVKSLLLAGYKTRTLAIIFECSRRNIRNIQSGRAWKDIKPL
jgi:hypothetical protein